MKLAEKLTFVALLPQDRGCGDLEGRELGMGQVFRQYGVEHLGLKRKRPSKNSARLGEHSGIDQAFRKRAPAFEMVSMFGVRGGVAPP
jgi:hypothetical protein